MYVFIYDDIAVSTRTLTPKRVRPCAQGRCGRCPPGSGVMSDLLFFINICNGGDWQGCQSVGGPCMHACDRATYGMRLYIAV